MNKKFLEPIFYHNGDNSTFLDAEKLSLEGIKLSKTSYIPNEKSGSIEFSFPKSDYVVKADVNFESTSKGFFLVFNNISTESLKRIKEFIQAKRSQPQISPSL